MTRVAVIGATGQLGSDLVRVLRERSAYEVTPLSHQDIECAVLDSVQGALSRIRPDVVVNCAAFVQVDECEDRPETAFRVNAVGALVVARECRELGARCIYISTDYVFDGTKGEHYTEDDAPNPINVYGSSKLAGEFLVRQSCSGWLIVRVASLFGRTGARGKGGNFVDTILDKARQGEPIKVVSDVLMSPTYTLDAARVTAALIEKQTIGLVHVSNHGSCSWQEFASTVLSSAGIKASVVPVVAKDYPTRARRPANSSLTSVRLDRDILELLPHWTEALRAYLEDKAYA